MEISLADWIFQVDTDATTTYTLKCSADHCECAYCRNFYQSVDSAHPTLRPVLARFGIVLEGPCEVMPFEPTLVMVCYRVTGHIQKFGNSRMHIDGVPLIPEVSEGESFLLWVGEMELPWLQSESMADVISPANEPAFMERMLEKWLSTRDINALS